MRIDENELVGMTLSEFEPAALHLAECVVPLFVEVLHYRPKALGTGFLVTKDSKYYLISAGHVLDHARSGSVFFYVGANTIAFLDGRVVTTPTSDPIERRDDPFDVGVVQVPTLDLHSLGEIEKAPLKFDRLRSNRNERESFTYLVTGFPGSKSGFHASNKQYESTIVPHVAALSPSWRYDQVGLDHENHIMVPFDSQISWGASGVPATLPAANGMSGCPIWAINKSAPCNSTVSGVIIESRNHKKNLIATDVAFAIHIINSVLK